MSNLFLCCAAFVAAGIFAGGTLQLTVTAVDTAVVIANFSAFDGAHC